MKITTTEDIELKKVSSLSIERDLSPIQLTDETMSERKQKLLNVMDQEGIDSLVIYGDLEHGSNFEYLTGFVTRFEEGILVLHKTGKAYLLLGNENLNKGTKARIDATAIHVPYFSLPNQPMNNEKPLADYFREAGITNDTKIGLVGWKLFTAKNESNTQLFDVPYYIVDSLMRLVGTANISNRSDVFIDPSKGVRVTNNANELAHYEFGAQLASEGILAAMNKIDIGVSEMDLGQQLNKYGQYNSVVTIAATGERFEKAIIYPTQKSVKLSDAISLTVGYKGGLSSRAGYAVQNQTELPEVAKDYLDVLAKPYFATVVNWLETIHVGMQGKELYQLIESEFPQSEFNWTLNPGHLTADEEWMSSPIYKDSQHLLKSGSMFQIDIIPNKKGYAGISCESTVALADSELRLCIKDAYPWLDEIFEMRRTYMKNELGINVHPDVLLMSDTVAFLRPYLLDKTRALAKT